MTSTIELPPDIKADLMGQVDAQGFPPAQYVRHLLRGRVPVRAGAAAAPTERAALWYESVTGLHYTPHLSDQAIGRESIR